MTDELIAREKSKGSPILPPKIFEQLGLDILPTAAIVREPGLRKPGRIESPKQKLKISTVLWPLIVIFAVILAFFFLFDPIKSWLNKPGGEAAVTPEASSSMSIPPMKPRVSAPVPADAEIDSAPVPPPTNDLLPRST